MFLNEWFFRQQVKSISLSGSTLLEKQLLNARLGVARSLAPCFWHLGEDYAQHSFLPQRTTWAHQGRDTWQLPLHTTQRFEPSILQVPCSVGGDLLGWSPSSLSGTWRTLSYCNCLNWLNGFIGDFSCEGHAVISFSSDLFQNCTPGVSVSFKLEGTVLPASTFFQP